MLPFLLAVSLESPHYETEPKKFVTSLMHLPLEQSWRCFLLGPSVTMMLFLGPFLGVESVGHLHLHCQGHDPARWLAGCICSSFVLFLLLG